jgi:hypothetical protein
MKILKSIGAVFAGFLTVVILAVITDTILEKAGVVPPVDKPIAWEPWMLSVALIYRTVYTVAGGYVTAKLAKGSPMKHVKVLAVIVTLATILGAIAGWNISDDHWYPITLAVLAFPAIWYGGKLATNGAKKK